MAPLITFEVYGEPVAKGRARHTRAGIAYTPAKTRGYESAVRFAAGQAMQGRPPLDEALFVAVTAVLPVPTSWSKKKTTAALAGELFPVGRPDADNFAKSILDGANTIVWTDDARIVDLHVRKLYGERPRVIVHVERAG